MNMQTTKWPAYTPAQARAMEKALLAVYRKEKRENAGKVPSDTVAFSLNRGKKTGITSLVRSNILKMSKARDGFTARDVINEFKHSESHVRNTIASLVAKGFIEQFAEGPQKQKIYRLTVDAAKVI